MPTPAMPATKKVRMVSEQQTVRTEEAGIPKFRNTTEKNIRWNDHSGITVHLVSASWLRFNSPEMQRPRFHLLLPKGKYRLTPLISVKLLQIFTAANWRNISLLCLTPSLWAEKLLKATPWLNSSSNLLGWTCEDKLLLFGSGENAGFQRSNQIRICKPLVRKRCWDTEGEWVSRDAQRRCILWSWSSMQSLVN